jgi:hypothetical protein
MTPFVELTLTIAGTQALAQDPRPPSTLNLADSEIIEKARNAQNGNKFDRLTRGDKSDVHYMAPSEEDLHRAMSKYTAWIDVQLQSVAHFVAQGIITI